MASSASFLEPLPQICCQLITGIFDKRGDMELSIPFPLRTNILTSAAYWDKHFVTRLVLRRLKCFSDFIKRIQCQILKEMNQIQERLVLFLDTNTLFGTYIVTISQIVHKGFHTQSLGTDVVFRLNYAIYYSCISFCNFEL